MNTPRKFFVSRFTVSVAEGNDAAVNRWLANRGFVSDGTGSTLCKGARLSPELKALELRVSGDRGKLVINVDGTKEVDFLDGLVSINGGAVTFTNSQAGGAVKGLHLTGCKESIVRNETSTSSTPPLYEDDLAIQGGKRNGAKRRKSGGSPQPEPDEGGGNGAVQPMNGEPGESAGKQLELIPADTIVSIPVKRIRPNPEQPRKIFRQSGLLSLGASLKQEGQQIPIKVVPISDPNADFELVMGERRWRAAQLVGVTHLKAIVLPKSEVPDRRKQFRLCMVMDFNQEGYTPLETALALLEERKHGTSVEELSKICGRSIAWVYQHLALNDLKEEFQKMLVLPNKGRMAFGVACRLAKFPQERQTEVWTQVSRQSGTRLQLLEIQRLAGEEDRSGPKGRRRKPADYANNLKNFLIPRLAGDATTASRYPEEGFNSLVCHAEPERVQLLMGNLDTAIEELAKVKKKLQEALERKG